MVLSDDQIKAVTLGAVSVKREDDGVRFHRFSYDEENYCKDKWYISLMRATSGIKMAFETNSRSITIVGRVKKVFDRRSYFAVDIKVNGVLLGAIKNFDESVIGSFYAEKEFEIKPFSETFVLGDGLKKVEIYLPQGVEMILNELCLDDDSSITPVRPKKLFYAYGDSITHGYDALHPSNTYAVRLADALGAELCNKGIGGMIFDPSLADFRENVMPDILTVAYGTNDFNCVSRDDLTKNCREFLKKISQNYPQSRIFVLSPIVRLDKTENDSFGMFSAVGEIIRAVVSDIPNAVFIDAFGYLPADRSVFADSCLHPNDIGFEHYHNGLYKAIIGALAPN